MIMVLKRKGKTMTDSTEDEVDMFVKGLRNERFVTDYF